jgi:hypothetical protein
MIAPDSCSARRHAASYSSARATLANNVTLPARARINSAAEAPVGLRMAATTTLVSSTSRILPMLSYYGRYQYRDAWSQCQCAATWRGFGPLLNPSSDCLLRPTNAFVPPPYLTCRYTLYSLLLNRTLRRVVKSDIGVCGRAGMIARVTQGCYCGSPTFRTNSANRGSERRGSSKKSVLKPYRYVSRS